LGPKGGKEVKMIDDLLRETETRMKKGIESMEDDYRGLRTGRAALRWWNGVWWIIMDHPHPSSSWR
jgi:ribosome recycling factor